MKKLNISGAAFWICVAVCVNSFSSCTVRELEMRHEYKMAEFQKEEKK